MIPTEITVKQERNNETVSTTTLPTTTTIKSNVNIHNPGLTRKNLEIICANKSVPPIDVSTRSIKPTPKPTKTPPHIAPIIPLATNFSPQYVKDTKSQ